MLRIDARVSSVRFSPVECFALAQQGHFVICWGYFTGPWPRPQVSLDLVGQLRPLYTTR